MWLGLHNIHYPAHQRLTLRQHRPECARLCPIRPLLNVCLDGDATAALRLKIVSAGRVWAMREPQIGDH